MTRHSDLGTLHEDKWSPRKKEHPKLYNRSHQSVADVESVCMTITIHWNSLTFEVLV